jgi:hypothetical protein
LREESTSFCEQKEAKKLFESVSGALSWAAKYPNKPVMPAKAGMTGGEQAAAEIRSFVISIVFNISYGFSFALF